jgi:gliding motility-associated-like protein
LTGPGLIWSGFAACPSSPPVGYWEILDGPPGAEFSDETQFNSEFTPGDFGTYDLHFFSATCGTDYYYEVIYSAPVAVDLIPEINECGGGGDPIFLEPTYENPLNDAEFDWTTGATSPNLTVTQSGTYCVTISNGCGSDEACVEVLVDPIPAVDVDPEYILCDQASLDVDPIAVDDDSYIYTWSGNGLNSSAPSVTITETGTYTLTVTNDCGTDNATFDVLLDPTPVLNSIEDAYVLCDEPSLFLDPISNDDPSFSYDWSGPGLNSSNSTETLTQNGSYTVTISNDCGTVSAEFDLTVVSDLSVTVNSLNLCDEPSGTLVATANQTVSYSWDNGETGSSIEVDSPGEYCVTVANACETQQDCGTVALNFTPNLSISPNSVENLCPGIGQTLSGNAGNAAGVSWTWSVECDGGLSTLNVNSDQISVSGDLANDNCPDGYTIIVTASNNCGTDAAEVDVTLDPCLVDFPNVITPGEGESNNLFRINGLENYYAFGGVQLQVFNRWGNLVYETSAYQNDWDGGDAVSGTYYFIVTLPNGDITKGPLTIIKP